MKYMLIMNTPRDGYTQYMRWPKALIEANVAFMHSFNKKLIDAGEFVTAAGLTSPEQALLVRHGSDGQIITDGVFPESKEFLAGYWIIDVPNRQRALEIAAEASKAPGTSVTRADGTTIDHLWIEVREVMGSQKDM